MKKNLAKVFRAPGGDGSIGDIEGRVPLELRTDAVNGIHGGWKEKR